MLGERRIIHYPQKRIIGLYEMDMATIQQYFSIGSSTSAKWLNDDEFVYLSTKSGVNQIWKKTLSTGKEEQLTFFGERVWSVHVSDG